MPEREPVLARLGALEVRLARTPAEIEAAFALRYAVFCEEMGADLAGADPSRRIETDAFDPFCDHIVVIDTALPALQDRPAVVGAYRALRPDAAVSGFYSQAEFDIAPLFAAHPDIAFCEVGRSCVAASHRSMRTIEALWCGLWAYACLWGIDVYFGAASFPGADPDSHAEALTFLARKIAAPKGWAAEAIGPTATAMDRLGPDAVLERQAILRAMPPLIRGYLRVNAHTGRSAYIDHRFGTTDIMIITRLASMPPAYRRHFEKVTGRTL